MDDFINKEQYPILIAEDSSSIRNYLVQILSSQGYNITACSDGAEAWDKFKSETYFPIIILDWKMPKMTGIEVATHIRKNEKGVYSYIVLLTGNDTEEEKLTGFANGIDDYLTKPFSAKELLSRLNAGCRMLQYGLNIQQECYKSLTDLAETRDSITGEHLDRMAFLAFRLAKELGCNNQFCENIKMFAPLHDIGKVGISDGILNLPREYTLEERAVMQTHPTLGWQILKDKVSMQIGAEIAYSHHENWDGTGYPRKLKGTEISQYSRIVHIVDVYDALRSLRPYKSAYSHAASIAFLKLQSGKLFEPATVEAFLRAQDNLCNIFDSMNTHKLRSEPY
jgi:putative two-component system response regulator